MGGLSRNRMKQNTVEVWRGIEHGSDVDIMTVYTRLLIMRGSYMGQEKLPPNPSPNICPQLFAGTHQLNGTVRFARLSHMLCFIL